MQLILAGSNTGFTGRLWIRAASDLFKDTQRVCVRVEEKREAIPGQTGCGAGSRGADSEIEAVGESEGALRMGGTIVS